jgi:hypothetical protein
MKRVAIGIAAALVLAGSVRAETAPSSDARVELPIKAERLASGSERFSVSILVGGKPVEAMLDTGSSGLRVLKNAIEGASLRMTGRRSQGVYGSGVRLVGEAADTVVQFGPLQTDTTIDLTTKAECVPEKPDCAASKIAQDRYRIGGDAEKGEGFVAILGTGLRRSDSPNPLRRLGSGRWIVILPRPGQGDGRLIINPSDAEMQGFQMFSLEPQPRPDLRGDPTYWDNRLNGCLIDEDARTKACEPTLLDTGAPGFRFTSKAEPKPNWARGVHAALAFPLDGDQVMMSRFIVGAGPGTAVRYARPTTEHFPEGLNAGFRPFFAYAVLYDSKAGKIGLKPR